MSAEIYTIIEFRFAYSGWNYYYFKYNCKDRSSFDINERGWGLSIGVL